MKANRLASLIALRRCMKQYKHQTVATPLHALVVPSSDAHNSEYLADRDKRRAFISGFNGSRGLSVITPHEALLWTDGRYFLQAERELDENWTLMKEGVPGVVPYQNWLAQNLEPGQTVGVDPMTLTHDSWRSLEEALVKAQIALVPTDQNLVDKVWSDQPSYPDDPIVPLDNHFTGKDWETKIDECRAVLIKEKVDCMLISALDDIAYVLNLRGADITFNPVFFAYLMISQDRIVFFLEDAKLTDSIKSWLKPQKSEKNIVQFESYESIKPFLSKYASSPEKPKILMSSDITAGLSALVPANARTIKTSPVALLKVIKNQTEIEGFIQSHIRDGAALCAYFAWLEKELSHGKDVTEISGAEKLREFRSMMSHFVGLSFETISSVGSNAAVIHYRPSEETNRAITKDEIYLVDSGAQYKDGTTDVTRTLHFGSPTAFERECFTRVLKGHIGLANAVFPSKLVGNYLDTLARQHLWEVGLDYVHGTGHGVGSFLNVHEGPIGISWRHIPSDPGLEENMVLSNEPGYYEDGKFGIRIENLVRVVKAETEHRFKDRQFLTFENLTLVPIQLKMVDPKLLSQEEVSYLNQYHLTCREKVGPLLREMGLEDGLKWLMKETCPMG